MLGDTLQIIIKHRVGFANGLLVTLQLCSIAWSMGIIWGSTLGFMAAKWQPAKFILNGLSFFISGIPVLVFLFWLHYPAQSFFGISVNPFITAAVMLSILNIIAVSSIVQNGIINIPYQYIEVARICGISSKDRIMKIEVPLFIRHTLPGFLISQVNVLHLSLFASLISVQEIFRVSQRIISIEYKPVEIYSALGIFFLLVSIPIIGVASYLRTKYSRNLSER